MQYPWKRRWHWAQMIGWDPTRMVPVHPEQTGPGFTSTSPALRRSSRRCRAGWAFAVVENGGCAPPIAQAGYVGPDSRICVRRLHLLAEHHVKVPDRCLRNRCWCAATASPWSKGLRTLTNPMATCTEYSQQSPSSTRRRKFESCGYTGTETFAATS